MKNEELIFRSVSDLQTDKLVLDSVGSYDYNVFRAILEETNALKLNKGVEIGVFEADFSSFLLKSFPLLSLLCVDPYVEYAESERVRPSMSRYERTAREKLLKYSERAELIKDFSVFTAGNVQNNSIDFVFIDALHTYEAVSEDLNAWYPKVRRGGVIAGHYTDRSGVKDAVEDFIAKIGQASRYTPSTSGVWFFLKN